jgi:uncharacterized membrane protein
VPINLPTASNISFARAIGRRLRRTYAWIFVIQAVAYYGKLAIHPAPLATLADLWEHAAIGPIPGGLVVVAGVLFHGGWTGRCIFIEARRWHWSSRQSATSRARPATVSEKAAA